MSTRKVIDIAFPIFVRRRLQPTSYEALRQDGFQDVAWVGKHYAAHKFRTGNQLEWLNGPSGFLPHRPSLMATMNQNLREVLNLSEEACYGAFAGRLLGNGIVAASGGTSIEAWALGVFLKIASAAASNSAIALTSPLGGRALLSKSTLS